MTDWVALLRGVNVGGITIRSADLAGVFRELGFDAVRTVLASGNVAFETDAAASARAQLKTQIEAALRDAVRLRRLDPAHHRATSSRRRSTDSRSTRPTRRASRGSSSASTTRPVTSSWRQRHPSTPRSTRSRRAPGVVYWNPRKGSSTDTPFAKLLAKKTFKPRTTNRNLRTLAKILG